MKKLRRFVSAIVFITAVLAINLLTFMPHRKLSSEQVSKKVLSSMAQIGISEAGSTNIQTVGSGVIVRSDGWILTARHCVGSASHIFIKLYNGHEYPVGFAILDAHRDLALLRIVPHERLTEITLGGSLLSVGQEIMAFGFPAHTAIGGLEATVSKGVISATERAIEEPISHRSDKNNEEKSSEDVFENRRTDVLDILFGTPKAFVGHMIQMDLMVNPGSSGGAIVNMDGQLIGVINSQLTETGGNIGMNFAIPVDDATVNILGLMGNREEVKLNVK